MDCRRQPSHRQLRCRECEDCALHLFTLGPVIESSTRLTFAPWAVSYPRLPEHFAAANLDPAATGNKWKEVHDFNDPEGKAATPNWRRLDDAAVAAAAWRLETVPGDEGGQQYGQAVPAVANPSSAGPVDASDAVYTTAAPAVAAPAPQPEAVVDEAVALS